MVLMSVVMCLSKNTFPLLLISPILILKVLSSFTTMVAVKEEREMVKWFHFLFPIVFKELQESHMLLTRILV